MGIFSEVLFCCDYDRTITAPDGHIPPENLEAIRDFMDRGGAFCMNTGRSISFFRRPAQAIPMNAPALLYNGAMAYDYDKEQVRFSHAIRLPLADTMREVMDTFPELLVELQGMDAHYLCRENPMWRTFIETGGGTARVCPVEALPEPFLKFAVYYPMTDSTVAQLFAPIPERVAVMDKVEQWARSRWGDTVTVERAGPQIVDVMPGGTGKGLAARELAGDLGRRILVCAGDAENDLSMLREADLPFVPADGVPALAEAFPNCAPCGRGAVADILARLPEILKNR